MKEKNKLIIAIVAVVAIIVIVVSGTFAYWTWLSSDEQQTSVSFTVSGEALQGQLYANLDGGGAETFDNLAPVSSCTNSSYAMMKTLSLNYGNKTANAANIYATLTVSNFQSPYGIPDKDAMSYLHYAVTTSPTNCSTGVVTEGTFTTADAAITSGPLFTDVNLLGGPISTDTDDTTIPLYLWVWIDGNEENGYEHTNIGDVISDPMQDISFDLTWSGTITNE